MKTKKALTIFILIIYIFNCYAISSFAASPIVPKQVTLYEGSSTTLSANIRDCDGTTKSWSTSDSSVISITSGGRVTAKKAGTATATCTTNEGESASCRVVVKAKATKKPTTTKKKTTKPKTTKKSTTKAKTTTKHTTTKKKKSNNSGNNNSDDSDIIVYTTSSDSYSYQTTASQFSDVLEDEETTTTTSVSENLTTTEPYSEDYGYENIDDIQNSNGESEKENKSEIDDAEISDELKISAVSLKKQPISISWTKIENADGYELYCVERKNSDNFDLIYDGKNNKYEKHCYENGKFYYFKVRYYQIVNGKRFYSDFSPTIQIQSVNLSLIQRLFA